MAQKPQPGPRQRLDDFPFNPARDAHAAKAAVRGNDAIEASETTFGQEVRGVCCVRCQELVAVGGERGPFVARRMTVNGTEGISLRGCEKCGNEKKGGGGLGNGLGFDSMIAKGAYFEF